MKISRLLAAAALMLTGPFNFGFAADEFHILKDVQPIALTDAEMDSVVGAALTLTSISTTTTSSFTTLSTSTSIVADNGAGFESDIGILFLHGACAGSTCGSGHLTGWSGGQDLPRGPGGPPGQQ